MRKYEKTMGVIGASLFVAVGGVGVAGLVHPALFANDQDASNIKLSTCGGDAAFSDQGSHRAVNEGQLDSRLKSDLIKLHDVALITANEIKFPNHLAAIATKNSLVMVFPSSEDFGSDNLTFGFSNDKPDTVSPGMIVCSQANNIYATQGYETINRLAGELNTISK
jgi:hypothetical protein